MNRDCPEGLRLRLRFEDALRQWGWFDAFKKAVDTMPVGPATLHQFQKQVKNAESALFSTRHDYAEHMAQCVKCSRRLVGPDAIPAICEKLKGLSEESRRI